MCLFDVFNVDVYVDDRFENLDDGGGDDVCVK